MKLDIHPSWKEHLKSELNEPYFEELIGFVKEEYSKNTCFPESDSIFEAFNRATFDKVKVVILGQDPYHGPHQPMGYVFRFFLMQKFLLP